nr:MAG TPA: hypothetical protein [Caudoviricetes sp.]
MLIMLYMSRRAHEKWRLLIICGMLQLKIRKSTRRYWKTACATLNY